MDRNRKFEDDMAFLAGYARVPMLVYSISISLKFKYIYFETPKAACSTIKRFLIRNESTDIRVGATEGVSYAEFAQFHDRAFSPLLNPQQVFPFSEKVRGGSYFRFCFVRNPYSRMLSAYLDQICGHHEFAKSAHDLLGLRHDPDDPVSFEAFVEAVCAQPIAAMDPHWKTQFFQTCQPAIEYDFIGRVERFDVDITRLADRLGLDLSLLERYSPHRTDSADKIADYLTPALRRKIYRKFEVDFVQFGYAE